jgi:hypothetical protein
MMLCSGAGFNINTVVSFLRWRLRLFYDVRGGDGGTCGRGTSAIAAFGSR